MGYFVWPLPGYSRISSPYGYRNCPFHGRELHTGIDIPAPKGVKVYAARDGKVVLSSYGSSYGNNVKLDHGGGTTTRYCHMSKLLVSVGQTVKAGQAVGEVGSTGQSTGNHLHFEVYFKGLRVNPLLVVSAKDTAANYIADQPVADGSSTPPSGSGGGSGTGSGETTVPTAPERKEITTVVIKSVDGQSDVQTRRVEDLEHAKKGPEIMIQADKVYIPSLVDEITLERPRKGGPAKLTFTVVKDPALSFFEGNPVSFTWNGEKLFFGFVFTKSRTDLTTIQVTAYDQIRYLKNKDTLSYADKTYAQLVKMIADDYGLVCGDLEDTKYKIPARIEETTLLDMLGNASDETVLNTGNLYVLYDEYGRLRLQSLASMKLPLMVDEDTIESYDYKSSIDSDTYTRVKLASDNSTTGTREVYVTNDEANQSKWGVLQYYEKEPEDVNVGVLQSKAAAILNYYGRVNRTLRLTGVLGDIRVRGGSLLLVNMRLGDQVLRNWMCVENAKHHFKEGVHTMDLTLSGKKGEFVA